jgi:uncharacterized protein YecE (DUF72 family)
MVSGRQAKLFAGTSGYSYPSWKPGFYPKNVPSTKFLEYYASRLNLVEVNFTFRQLGKASTFEKWIASTPPGFIFSPKAHNKITHILRLKNAEEFTRTFLGTLAPFCDSRRLGPILFQLPPTFKADPEVLGHFVQLLPKDYHFAFEFRHESWFSDATYGVLRDHNTALCLAESEERETPEVVTADFIYFRLRKPEYSDSELKTIADKAAQYREQGLDVYALFKHEESPAGALYAERLLASQRNGTDSV